MFDGPYACCVIRTGKPEFSMKRRVTTGIAFFHIEQRPSSGKAVFDSMPVGDVWLADLPAQKHHFFADHTGKIDQALFGAFANAAVTIDFLHPTLELSYQPGNFPVFLQTFHQIRRVGIQVFVADNGFAFAPQPANVL